MLGCHRCGVFSVCGGAALCVTAGGCGGLMAWGLTECGGAGGTARPVADASLQYFLYLNRKGAARPAHSVSPRASTTEPDRHKAC